MKLLFTHNGWEDYQHWVDHDREMLDKANKLIKDMKRDPFTGLGKPEPLKANLKGWWSRRLTLEHRIVYRVVGKDDDQRIEIATCRKHY